MLKLFKKQENSLESLMFGYNFLIKEVTPKDKLIAKKQIKKTRKINQRVDEKLNRLSTVRALNFLRDSKETNSFKASMLSNYDVVIANKVLKDVVKNLTPEEIDLLLKEIVSRDFLSILYCIEDKGYLSNTLLWAYCTPKNPSTLIMPFYREYSFYNRYLDYYKDSNFSYQIPFLDAIQSYNSKRNSNWNTDLFYHAECIKDTYINSMKIESLVDKIGKLEKEIFLQLSNPSKDFMKYIHEPKFNKNCLNKNELLIFEPDDLISQFVSQYKEKVNKQYLDVQDYLETAFEEIKVIKINNLVTEYSLLEVLNSIVNLIRFRPKSKNLEFTCTYKLISLVENLEKDLKDYLTYKGRIKDKNLTLTSDKANSVEHAKDLLYVINRLKYV